MTETTTETRELTQILGNLPKRLQHYVARVQDLDTIESCLGEASTPQVILITGLGGCGKTQLASRYAHKSKAEETYDLIGWFSISDSIMQQSALMTIARHTGLPPCENITIIFPQCIQSLGQKNRKTLLVFDDAYELTLFEALLESDICPKNVHILVTSRHSTINIPQIELDVFSEEESHQYVNRVFPGAKDHDIKKLSAQLGFLPLAMCQAVSYMQMSCESIEGYLSLYQEQAKYKQHLLDLPVDSYNCTIWTTWDVSISNVIKSSPLTAKVLRLFYYLYSDKIPRSLLVTVCQDRLELNKVINILIRYSIISVSQDGNYLSIHSLVQLIMGMKFQLDLFSEDKDDETLRALLDTLAAEFYFSFDYSFVDWQEISALIPNVMSVLQHALSKKIYTPSVGILLHHLGLIQYFDLIQPNQSHKSLLSALLVVKKSPNASTLSAAVLYSDIAVNAVNLLRYSEAYKDFQQSIEHFHPHPINIASETSARVVSNLSYTHIRISCNISRYIASLSSFQLLTLADPTFQHSLSNYLKVPLQDYAAILEHQLKLHDILSRHYGATHFLVARQHYNLALTYSLIPDYKNAKLHCDLASTLYERCWGCSAIETLYVCRHSSIIDFLVNDLPSALEKAKKILELTSEYHSANIISHAFSLFHYGALLCENDEKEKALDYLLKARDAFSEFSKLHFQPLSLLLKAIEFGYIKTVETLLAHDICLITERDASGNTALLVAAFRHRINMVELLLSHSSNLSEKNYFGVTPALWAAYRGNYDFLQHLLTVCSKDTFPELLAMTDHLGDGLLSLAVVNKHSEVVTKLLEEHGQKWQIDRVNHFGYSPLFLAQFYGYYDIATILLANTHRKHHTDKFSCTPAQLVKIYRAIYDESPDSFIELTRSLTGLCFCGITAYQFSESQFSFVLTCLTKLPNIKHLIFAHQIYYHPTVDNLANFIARSENIQTLDLRVLFTAEPHQAITNSSAVLLLNAYEQSVSLRELSLLNHPLPDALTDRLHTLNAAKQSRFEDSQLQKSSNIVLNFNGNKIAIPKREAECLVYLADGLSAKQTADKLHLSQRTVEVYIDKLKKRFSCRTKLELLSIISPSDIEFLRNSLRISA